MIPFSHWRGVFKGEDCVVVAPGPSSRKPELDEYYRERWTIGCNRAVVYCRPDYAICVEPFGDPVWPIIRSSPAHFVFSHLAKNRQGKVPHPRLVNFNGKDVKRWFRPREADPGEELWVAMSPFWAAAVAAWLGFDTVGLIGVDLTEDRYPNVLRINTKWRQFLDLVQTPIVNLSKNSRLYAAPQGARYQIRPKGYRSQVLT